MKKLFFAPFVLLLFTACSVGKTVHTDINRSASFGQYRSFAIADEFRQGEGAKPENFNDLAYERLTDALKSEMKGRGYQHDTVQPDLLVSFFLRVEKEMNYNTRPSYWNPWGSDVNTWYETNSTLGINLVDTRTQKLVWQGYLTDSWDKSPEKRDRKLREAIGLIFTEYPYRAPAKQVF